MVSGPAGCPMPTWAIHSVMAMATVMPCIGIGVGYCLNETKECFQMQSLLTLISGLLDNTEMQCKVEAVAEVVVGWTRARA